MDQGIMTLITVGIVLGAAAFVLWLLYTVIWHGVRRGMQEFRLAQDPVAVVHHHHLFHRDHSDVVPDYPPREWVDAPKAPRTPRRAP
jgi:hypothetical protein